ncbi:MAG: polysaccharide deacetylase family protein [Clostridia bacterium]|nr:polysaccharide deacetylase family protein [Clostridia bacterium]
MQTVLDKSIKRVNMRFPGFKMKALTLSYDDGVVFDRKLMQIMDEYGLKGTFNINTGLFANSEDSRRLTKEGAYKLYANSGHEVAVHGVKHLSLPNFTTAAMANDILNDRKELEKMFDRLIFGCAYANGHYDQESIDVLKTCGIKYSRGVKSTERFDVPQKDEWLKLSPTCHHKNPKLMELAEKFVNYNEEDWGMFYRRPMLFYLWGHSYEFNDNNNWEIIENFAKYVGKRDDVWYATNIEIYNYVTAYDNLEYSVEYDKVYNPSNIDVYLFFVGGRRVLAKAGQVTPIPPEKA